MMEKLNKCTPDILKFSTVNTINKQGRIEKKKYISKKMNKEQEKKLAEIDLIDLTIDDESTEMEIAIKQLDFNSQRRQFYLAVCEKLNEQPEQNQPLVSIPATCRDQQQSPKLFDLVDNYCFKTYDIDFYYNKLFPVNALIDLFSLNNAYKTQNREFMFKVTSYCDPEEVFVKRNLNDSTAWAFKHRLNISKPHQIDIGPIYEKPPQKGIENKVIAREHLIDIDLSDYDEIRTCCKDKNMCQKCWKYAALACKILNKEIKEYWQYKHIMWVYSGRRGIHGWIFDKKARESDVEERTDVTNFFSVVKSGTNKKRVTFRSPLHPLISDNFQLCLKFFVDVCIEEQDLLNDLENISYFLEQVPKVFRQDLLTEFKYYKTSLQRWNYFLLYYEAQMNNNDNKVNKKFVAECKYLVEEIVIQYTFPRLDCPVSVQKNHVLKCPFSFHPKTGKVALVIDPTLVELFNPDEAPRFDEIVEQFQFTPIDSSGLHKFHESVEYFKDLLIQIKQYEQLNIATT